MNKNNRGLNNSARWNLGFISFIFALIFLVTGFSYVRLAVTGQKHGYNLHQLALNQYLSGGVDQAKRGNILDRNGEALALQTTAFTLFANLNEDHGSIVEDIEYTAQQLSTVLDLSQEEITQLLSAENRSRVEFGRAGRQLSFVEKEQIDAMELSGINFTEEARRFYPNGMFASHTIGFTHLDQEQVSALSGQMGVELYFDEILRGMDGRYQYLRDRRGYLQRDRQVYTIEETVEGHDVYLTVDSTIQIFLENALESVWQDANPESLVAIVADPKTGEILAIGSRSSFDPNVREIDNYHNLAISEPFEPGSTLKVYTYAAAINEGSYNGDMLYNSGIRTLDNGTPIRDFDQRWGSITYNEGFHRSSNTAIVDILNNWLTPDKFLEYLSAFGFGSPVGISLPDESAGMIPVNAESTQKITAGYGQGILTTPIQHIQAMTAILNQGQLIRPQLISHIYDPNEDEVVYEFEVDEIGNPITSATAEQVKELMIGVVEEGSGQVLYNLGEISSGGKTGTAQIADGPRGYLSNEFLYSYVGFAPADDPELVMYLAMSRPESTAKSGHAYLSEIYQFVMTQSLNYLGTEWVPLINHENHNTVQIPTVLNQHVQVATELLEAEDFETIVIGNKAQVFAQFPTANTLSTQGRKVFIQTDIVDELPDFTGWNRTEVNQYRTLLGLEVVFSGEGSVTEQSLEPGTEVGAGDTIYITLDRDS